MTTSQEPCLRWAQQLLAAEASIRDSAAIPTHPVLRVYEKFRVSLTRFIGPDGFAALMGRSLALARATHPVLNSVEVAADGRLRNIEELIAGGEGGVLAATAVSAQLLGLLVAFVGESLTVRLVREVWPEAPLGLTMKTEVS